MSIFKQYILISKRLFGITATDGKGKGPPILLPGDKRGTLRAI